MKACYFALVLVGIASMGCGSSSEGVGSPTGGSEQGHALGFAASLKEQGGELSFMTPAVSVVKVPVANIVGKPYLVASYPAGFSPGNDPAIHSTWGTVPSDLVVRYTTPKTYKDGPYDMVLVIYASTPITDAIKSGPAQTAPAARNGDLATFTIDMSAVLPGDPAIPAGLVRLNVAGGDAHVAVENKVAVDPADIGNAFTNTVMILP